VEVARSDKFDAVIYLADLHFVSTWAGAAIARARGRPVLFWGHGWLAPERRAKAWLRRAYFALSHRFLVYAERGKRLGVASGYAAERITVVYNSLDVARADAVIAGIASGVIAANPRALFAQPERPLLICTARLTARCRFDLLIEAAALLAHAGRPVNVLLVGEGSERAALEQLAVERGVALHFWGACHNEEILGPMLYHADLTVSPGKVGLTAMHSLMYGTPVVTHGDLDAQMPEVEAIEPGHTGAFFRRGDAHDLAATIARWLDAAPPRAQVRSDARAAISARWTPQNQARIIEQAVLEVTGHG
jgi:glycosyltransferase involved in cell wall biosynthesis